MPKIGIFRFHRLESTWGASLSYTELGPPLKIIPFGLNDTSVSRLAVQGNNSQ